MNRRVRASLKFLLHGKPKTKTGGGGGSRTRVRKKSLEASTCLAGVLISPEETSTDRIPAG